MSRLEDERAAFEQWAWNHLDARSWKHPNGEYVYLESEWSAWQARAALNGADAGVSEGWVLYSADFSRNADDPTRPGRVMFRRDAAGYAEWLALETPEAREGFELFRSGVGKTLNEAISNAFAPSAPTQGGSHGE